MFKMNACKFQGIIVERARVPLQLCEYIHVRNVSGPTGTPEMSDEEGWLRRQQGGVKIYATLQCARDARTGSSRLHLAHTRPTIYDLQYCSTHPLNYWGERERAPLLRVALIFRLGDSYVYFGLLIIRSLGTRIAHSLPYCVKPTNNT